MEAPADISMDYKGKIRLATVTFGPICENTGGKLQTKRLRLFTCRIHMLCGLESMFGKLIEGHSFSVLYCLAVKKGQNHTVILAVYTLKISLFFYNGSV